MTLLIWIGICVVCAVLSETIARHKGYLGLPWVLGGLIVGPLALLGVALLPNRRMELLLREQLRLAQGGGDDATLDRELVAVGLKPKSAEQALRDTRAKWMFSILAAVAILWFLARGF